MNRGKRETLVNRGKPPLGREDSNTPRKITEIPQETEILQEAVEPGTESGTHYPLSPSLPTDLAMVVSAWPNLPPAIRAGILAMIQATKSSVT